MEYGIVITLVVVATALGLVWRSRQGRVVEVSGSTISRDFRDAGKTTILQFTTELCAPCKQLKPRLEQIAVFRSDVSYRDIDAVEHRELASALGIRSTPTTLIVAPDGEIRARINGIAPVEVFLNAIDGRPADVTPHNEEVVI